MASPTSTHPTKGRKTNIFAYPNNKCSHWLACVFVYPVAVLHATQTTAEEGRAGLARTHARSGLQEEEEEEEDQEEEEEDVVRSESW